MGFVTLEKSEKEELFKKKPGAMTVAELKQLREKHIQEQVKVRAYLKALKESGGTTGQMRSANTILLALKTIDTQIGSLMRTARR